MCFSGLPSLFKEKPYLVHFLLLAVVLIFSLIGGLMFIHLENEDNEKDRKNMEESMIECINESLAANSNSDYSMAAIDIFRHCVNDSLPRTQWSIIGGCIFSFASITTLGFGSLAVNTQNGRLFYIIFCLIGMPLGLILMGNLGKFMEELVAKLKRRLDQWDKERRRRNKEKANLENGLNETNDDGDEEDEEEFEMTGLIVLAIFGIYVGTGITVMMIISGLHVIDSTYSNFLSFTAVDLSGIVSTRFLLFPIGIVYVMGGLALASLAIEVLGRYLKQLHHWGRKLANCGRVKIWFGGKRIKVKNLVGAVGKHWGVAKDKIEKIDLDEIVKQQIALQEGRINAEPELEPFIPRKMTFGEEVEEIAFFDDEPDIDDYFEHVIEPKVFEPVPEHKPDPILVSEPAPEPDQETLIETESDDIPLSATVQEPDPEPVIEIEPNPIQFSKPVQEIDPEPNFQPKPEPIPVSEPVQEPDPDPVIETESDPISVCELEQEPGPEPICETDPIPVSEPVEVPDPETRITEPEPVSEPEAEPEPTASSPLEEESNPKPIIKRSRSSIFNAEGAVVMTGAKPKLSGELGFKHDPNRRYEQFKEEWAKYKPPSARRRKSMK